MEDKRAAYLISKYFTRKIIVVEGNLGQEVQLPKGLIQYYNQVHKIQEITFLQSFERELDDGEWNAIVVESREGDYVQSLLRKFADGRGMLLQEFDCLENSFDGIFVKNKN